MLARVLSAIRVQLTKWEGWTDWIYLDTEGNCTIGVGLLLRTPPDAAWLDLLAVPAWHVVHESPRGMEARWYKQRSPWRADPNKLDQLFSQRLAGMEKDLKVEFPDHPNWPIPAQTALYDWAWNKGPSNVGWPKLTAALKSCNWGVAADECGVSNPHNYKGVADRNADRAGLFKSLVATLKE